MLDGTGRGRSSATTPGHHVGRAGPQGRLYAADPPTLDEITVMGEASNDRHGRRLRALIVVVWRAGPGIHETLALTETDRDHRRAAILVRHGKTTSHARPAWMPA